MPATRFDPSACQHALQKIESDLNLLASGLTEAQFQAPPRAGGWSVAYCIEHLVLTGQAFLATWETVLHSPAVRRHDCDDSPRYQSYLRSLLYFLEPPYRMKLKTSYALSPNARRCAETSVRRLLSTHQEFTRIIEISRGRDLQQTNLRAPIFSWLRVPLAFSFDLALAHERRHLWQARQVRALIVGQE